MLKRQRLSSPIPIADAPLGPEPALDIDADLLERVTKRRRQFAPARHNSGLDRHAKQAHHAAVVDDDDDGEEDVGRSEYTRGKAKWQEEAGLYKAANTLLHDLHAEQKHRITFASFPAPSSSFGTHPLHNHPPQSSIPHHTSSQSPASPAEMYYSEPQNKRSEQTNISNPVRTSDEAQMVNQRYEDTNRLLGSLFLTRRHQLDMPNTTQT